MTHITITEMEKAVIHGEILQDSIEEADFAQASDEYDAWKLINSWIREGR